MERKTQQKPKVLLDRRTGHVWANVSFNENYPLWQLTNGSVTEEEFEKVVSRGSWREDLENVYRDTACATPVQRCNSVLAFLNNSFQKRGLALRLTA